MRFRLRACESALKCLWRKRAPRHCPSIREAIMVGVASNRAQRFRRDRKADQPARMVRQFSAGLRECVFGEEKKKKVLGPEYFSPGQASEAGGHDGVAMMNFCWSPRAAPSRNRTTSRELHCDRLAGAPVIQYGQRASGPPAWASRHSNGTHALCLDNSTTTNAS